MSCLSDIARRMTSKLFRRAVTRPRPMTHLRCEALEDRTVPTPVITAATLADTAEGDAVPGAVEFSRTGDTSQQQGIFVSVGGSASGNDYSLSGISGSVVFFAAGSATADVTVTPVDDTAIEPDETVAFTIQSGGGSYTIGTPGSATVIIHDNDTPVVTVAFLNDTIEGGTPGAFWLSRTGNTSQSLTVSYAVDASSGATAGSDYTALSGSVTFAANSATADVSVSPIDDTITEYDESVNVAIQPGGYTVGVPDSATVIIRDNEQPLVMVEWVADPLEGSWSGWFAVSRMGDKTNALTVNFAVTGTATSGTDYTSLGTSVTIDATATVAYLEVAALADETYDPDETIIVTLQTGTGYTLAPEDEATLTIEDATPVVTVQEWAAAYEDGREGTFHFARTGDLTDELVVDVAISGSATPDADYEALSTTVTFPAGESEVDVTVTPIDDAVADPGEYVRLTIQTSVNYLLGAYSEADVLVVDDESPVVTVWKIADGAEGGADAAIEFHRTGDTTNSLAISYTATAGTATSGADYTALSGSVTFPAGEDTVDVPIAIIEDTAIEGTETIFVSVTSGTNYGADPDATALVNIADDDGGPGEIAGQVFEDANGNGIFDSGEALLAGKPVNLLDEWGGLLFQTVTNASGAYNFVGLALGTYSVQVYAPMTDWYTSQDQGTDESVDSDINPDTGMTEPISLTTTSPTNLLVGAGFVPLAPPPPPPPSNILVYFSRPDGSILPPNGNLKVAKWSDAFEVDPKTRGLPLAQQRNHVRAPGADKLDFIDRLHFPLFRRCAS